MVHRLDLGGFVLVRSRHPALRHLGPVLVISSPVPHHSTRVAPQHEDETVIRRTARQVEELHQNGARPGSVDASENVHRSRDRRRPSVGALRA